MNRLFSAIKTDIKVQYRNKLYFIGASISALIGVVAGLLFDLSNFQLIFVALLLLIVGGSTLLYVGAIIIFEKEEGIISASLVTPQPISDYLLAKIVSLTILASFEALLILLILSAFSYYQLGHLPALTPYMIFALLFICVIYVLIGMILVMPYDSITDYIMPMAGVILILQLPIIHFFGIYEHFIFYIFPISAPASLSLTNLAEVQIWQLSYGFGYSILVVILLFYYAMHQFKKHMLGGQS